MQFGAKKRPFFFLLHLRRRHPYWNKATPTLPGISKKMHHDELWNKTFFLGSLITRNHDVGVICEGLVIGDVSYVRFWYPNTRYKIVIFCRDKVAGALEFPDKSGDDIIYGRPLLCKELPVGNKQPTVGCLIQVTVVIIVMASKKCPN